MDVRSPAEWPLTAAELPATAMGWLSLQGREQLVTRY